MIAPACRRLARGPTPIVIAALLLVLTAPAASARELQIPTFLSPGRNADESPSVTPGAHPYELYENFTFNQSSTLGAADGPAENVRDLSFELPPGFLASAASFPRCSAEAFASRACATVTQIGVAELQRSGGAPDDIGPIFNLIPPPRRAAQFGIHAEGFDARIDVSIRGGTDYGATATLRAIGEPAGLIGSTVRIWGVPGDPAHDAERFDGSGSATPGPYPEPPPFKALLTNPTACDGPLITTMEAATWQSPTHEVFAAPFEAPAVAGCDQLEFAPAVEAKPSTNIADSPSGLDFHLHVPQIRDPEGSVSAELRRARVNLPAGLSINPAAANGIGTCTPAQIGLTGVTSDRQLLRYDLPPASLSGAFTVSREGHTTPVIPATATRSEVATAIETLPGLAGNAAIGGAPGGWIIEFVGTLAGTDVPLLSGEVIELPATAVAVTAQGGTFTLESGGQSTSSLPFDADADEIKEALRQLPSLSLGNVYPGNVFTTEGGEEDGTRTTLVYFGGDLNGTTPPISADSSLTGPEAGIEIGPSGSPPTRTLSIVGFRGPAPGTPQFSAAPATCPDASKVGTVRVDSPEMLDHPLTGAVYLATPGQNPFGSLLAIYLTVTDQVSGIIVKLPARVDPDPEGGGLQVTLAEDPQLPFEDLSVELFKGSGAPLRTPSTCGDFKVSTELTPWSAPEGAIRRPGDAFAIEQRPEGGSCPTDPAAVPDLSQFSAGTLEPVAGAASAFLLKLTRPDGSRSLTGLDTTLPPGLLASLAGRSYCPDASLTAAAARAGIAELAQPSCPTASRLGGLDLSAGAGPTPYNLSGDAYLAGPYRGGPLSLAMVIPVVAGPFDLGTVVNRAALSIDPRTARVRVASDPFPAALSGLAVDLRSVSLHLDPGFARNPTSCYPLQFDGGSPRQSARFQVGDCQRLSFKPKVSLALKGPTKVGAHPALSATLTNPVKGTPANLAAAAIHLPSTLRVDRRHFRAGEIGQASVSTPLLDRPLSGPVTISQVTSKSARMRLNLGGQIDVEVEGALAVDKNGATSVSFTDLPDVSISKLTLTLAGGKSGPLVASRGLCAKPRPARSELTGQNTATYDTKVAIKTPCREKSSMRKRGPK